MKIKNLFLMLKEKFGGLFKKNKKLFFIGLAIIVVLVFFVMSSSDKDSETQINQNDKVQSISLDKYEDEIAEKLKNMLLSIEEIKSASVMVVCDASEVVEYLKNTTETTSGSGGSESKTVTQEVVYEKNGSNSYPIVVSKSMPKVVGVWIVINEISPSTKLAITNSICSVLNLSETSISILQER